MGGKNHRRDKKKDETISIPIKKKSGTAASFAAKNLPSDTSPSLSQNNKKRKKEERGKEGGMPR